VAATASAPKFARDHLARVREVAPQINRQIEDLDAAYAELHRDHPFHRSPDFVAALRNPINQPPFQAIVGRLLHEQGKC
jgi:hypothetical protein